MLSHSAALPTLLFPLLPSLPAAIPFLTDCENYHIFSLARFFSGPASERLAPVAQLVLSFLGWGTTILVQRWRYGLATPFFMRLPSMLCFSSPLHPEAEVMTQVGEPVSGLVLEARVFALDFDFHLLFVVFPFAKKDKQQNLGFC